MPLHRLTPWGQATRANLHHSQQEPTPCTANTMCQHLKVPPLGHIIIKCEPYRYYNCHKNFMKWIKGNEETRPRMFMPGWQGWHRKAALTWYAEAFYAQIAFRSDMTRSVRPNISLRCNYILEEKLKTTILFKVAAKSAIRIEVWFFHDVFWWASTRACGIKSVRSKCLVLFCIRPARIITLCQSPVRNACTPPSKSLSPGHAKYETSYRENRLFLWL